MLPPRGSWKGEAVAQCVYTIKAEETCPFHVPGVRDGGEHGGLRPDPVQHDLLQPLQRHHRAGLPLAGQLLLPLNRADNHR